MLTILVFTLSLVGVLAWYFIRTLRILRSHGFDPSLVTYLTPFSLYNYAVARLAIVVLLAATIINTQQGIIYLVGSAIFLFASLQVLLLLAFERTGTQPIGCYILLVFCAATSLFGVPNIWQIGIFTVALIVQEAYLRVWQRTRKRHYDKWVEKKVRHLNHKYRSRVPEITDKEWFYTLHFAVTESIARPWLSRLGERLYFRLRHPPAISSGIMQVKASELLTDAESMIRGSVLVCDALRQMPAEITESLEQLKWLARAYNGSLNEAANADYTGYLLSTYPGLVAAWETIRKRND